VNQNHLVLEGFGRGARYRIPEPTLPPATPATTSKEGISLSTVAQELRESVHNPLHLRRPVGYNRKFLDEYRPNVTEYLSPALRHELANLGRYPEGDAPAGTYARHIFNRLLIDLSWNSSRLEGNTYSLLETQRLLEIGASAEGKTIEDTQMLLNHKAAIEMLVDEAESIGFNRYTILNLHGLLSENLLDDPSASGRLRESPVGIGGTVYHPLEIPQVIRECFDQILATAEAIQDPFEQAFFAMVHLPYLQPFQDVNKRVSRLAANIPLIRFNLCPLSFVDVPQRDYVDGMLVVYELNRIELLREVFVWAYNRSCQRYSAVRQVLGEPDPFRLRYREPLKSVVGEVVRNAMDKAAATAFVHARAAAIPEEDRARFIEVAETELLSLHEGNFMRYRVRPSEFERWLEHWR
jgi:fido (protein-threonine AMPylation protein)